VQIFHISTGAQVRLAIRHRQVDFQIVSDMRLVIAVCLVEKLELIEIAGEGLRIELGVLCQMA
jgi:hypothetical protein